MLLASFQYNNTKVTIVQDDITKQETDAIVNAANSHLKHGGGVAAAIVRAGGEEIQKESDEWVKRHGPVPTSSVAVTGAGKLKAKYVIHTVGPVWGEGNEHEKLYKAVKNVLSKAQELGLKTISIPAISSGIFGFPKDECAKVFLKAIKDFLSENPKTTLEEIRLCNIDKETSEIFFKTFTENWR
ncbi:macro domain-containing protein [Pseudothermotoga thermarum]|uniref:Appr-1-p processing domain protein n=1 Tax=Pseudothermotoga thermarum DSM 5069 TaxID=688269 RepID=F7YWE0_9THEM|nr:macro domain-containing protein [Pseudothermotoga thermarum]AEH51918.1 Appr-1-p processing domain protein [Pseudothermotoga thermarum DSM 5069]